MINGIRPALRHVRPTRLFECTMGRLAIFYRSAPGESRPVLITAHVKHVHRYANRLRIAYR